MSGLPRPSMVDEDSDKTPTPPADPTGAYDDAKEPPKPPPPPLSGSAAGATSHSGSGSSTPVGGAGIRVSTPQSTHNAGGMSLPPPPDTPTGSGGSSSNTTKKKSGLHSMSRSRDDFVARHNSGETNGSSEKVTSSSNPLHQQSNSANMASLVSPISPLDEIKDEQLESVEFTALLRQVDVGLEMTELLKEVVRKYSKHQNADATKLQEIYGKMKNVYLEMDGMHEFAEVCNLTHKLILETVQQQKVLAEFLGNELVPRLTQHLQEKQSAVQILKKENQQAELKLQTTMAAMRKAENSFKNAAKRARSSADPTPRKKTVEDRKKGGIGKGLKGLGKGIKKAMNKQNNNLTEEEETYIKADQLANAYEAAVMTANHAQDKHIQICRHFKYRLRAIEESRMSYCKQQMKIIVNKHKEMFENDEIERIRSEIIAKADVLDATTDFDSWASKSIQTRGKSKQPERFVTRHYDYENAFYSLEDALKVTRKLQNNNSNNNNNNTLSPTSATNSDNNNNTNNDDNDNNNNGDIATVPLMMTTLCERIKKCKGFTTEGIFRISASVNDIDYLRKRLYNNNYKVESDDPHVSACMLKEWLRGLKDSLIPGSYYDVCVDMAKQGNIDAQRLDVFISQLPEVNRDTIRYLVQFLKELLNPKNTKITKMNVENISIVFAPTVLRCPRDDPQLMLMNSRHEQAFMTQLIEKLKS